MGHGPGLYSRHSGGTAGVGARGRTDRMATSYAHLREAADKDALTWAARVAVAAAAALNSKAIKAAARHHRLTYPRGSIRRRSLLWAVHWGSRPTPTCSPPMGASRWLTLRRGRSRAGGRYRTRRRLRPPRVLR